MKAFSGYKPEENKRGQIQLPAGPYVAKIINVKIDGNEPEQTLVLRLDVAEGEYAGYYAKRYKRDSERENAQYPAKYKGDFRIRIPNPQNKKALYPESDLANFNDAMWRIQESNPGYTWEWDENSLRGLYVGINVQQGSYNGKQFTRIGKLEIVSDVRSGKVNTMAPMEPRSDAYEAPGATYTPPVTQQVQYTEAMAGGFTKVDTDELPF